MTLQKTQGVSAQNVLDRLLRSYSGYYNISRQSRIPQFSAEAEFRLHDEQYFLTRTARIAEADSREIIFFAVVKDLDAVLAEELSALAWEEGQARVKPGPDHQCTDIGLVILADHVHKAAADKIRKYSRSKSFRFGLHGYSRFRLAVHDLSENVTVRNRMGDSLEKVISNINLCHDTRREKT